MQESGLSAWVAQRLKFLAGVPRAAVILIIIVISALFTEVTSNTSTANIFFPVLDAVVTFISRLYFARSSARFRTGAFVGYASWLSDLAVHARRLVGFHVTDW